MQTNSVKIHATCLDERSYKVLSFFFKKYCHARCEMTGEDQAEVFLINMDHPDAEKQCTRIFEHHPASPIILMALKPRETGNHYFLRKPMIADHLLAIIDDIANKQADHKITAKKFNSITIDSAPEPKLALKPKLEATPVPEAEVSQKASSGHAAQLLGTKEDLSFVGVTKDIELSDKLALASIQFNPDHYLMGVIIQAYQLAKKECCIVKITGLLRTITMFPDTGEVYVELTDRQLQPMCVVDLNNKTGLIKQSDIVIEESTRNEEWNFCTKSRYFQSLDLFIWKVALWTSRGRLPDDIDITRPVYIQAWPNLTRLIVTPYALKIIAFWLSEPRSLTNMVTALAIPQRYIFSLFTASYYLGLAGQARRASDELVVPTPIITPTNKTGLFSRILNKIRQFN
jgi:hypothetical protein